MAAAEACAALWDMDGTLVDTAELHFAAWEAVCRERGRDFTRADFAATFGQRNPEILQILFGDTIQGRDADAFGDRKEEMYRAAAERQGVALLPGGRALLEGLHRAGVRQAIGSSAPRANLDLILRLTDTTRYFGAVASMEDTQRGKPDPQVFLVAAERLGVRPARCVVLEDAVAGVEAARNGGMKCVAVRFVAHHSEEKLLVAGADRVVGSLEELTAKQILDLIG